MKILFFQIIWRFDTIQYDSCNFCQAKVRIKNKNKNKNENKRKKKNEKKNKKKNRKKRKRKKRKVSERLTHSLSLSLSWGAGRNGRTIMGRDRSDSSITPINHRSDRTITPIHTFYPFWRFFGCNKKCAI